MLTYFGVKDLACVLLAGAFAAAITLTPASFPRALAQSQTTTPMQVGDPPSFTAKITAVDLKSEFDANNLRAERKFSGRTYEVSGKFDGAESALFDNSTHIRLAGERSYDRSFFASLADGEDQKAVALNKGDTIRIRCMLKGTIMGTPTGSNCTIVVDAAAAVPVRPIPSQEYGAQTTTASGSFSSVEPARPVVAAVSSALTTTTSMPAPAVETASPVPTAIYSAPTTTALTSVPSVEPANMPADPDFVAFKRGKRDRIGWETFFAQVIGNERDGALWWSGQRSLKTPGSCSSGPSQDFRHGCEEAQAILGPSDMQRKANPAYRAGWNSY